MESCSGSSYESSSAVQQQIIRLKPSSTTTPIKSRYYKNDGNIITTYGEYDDLGTTNERVLDNKITVISVPQSKKGLGIKPGSVLLTEIKLIQLIEIMKLVVLQLKHHNIQLHH